MLTPEDKKEISEMVSTITSEIVERILRDIKIKKAGDSPIEFYDLVNKGFLQMHGPRATARPAPSTAIIGQMFFDTTGNGQPQWVDSAGANWRDAAGNIVA